MANTSSPLVSIIMPAYNAALYITSAIESILNQTYQHFEFIIFDDYSTDNTITIIESFTDKRIILIKKNKNTGYTNSLIMGIKMAKGKYIARMDSDDISVLNRIEKQVDFLENNIDYGIVGAYVKTMQTNKESQVWKYPVDDEKIKCYTIVNSPFAHPTVLIRKSVLEQYQLSYKVDYEPCEDYKLWVDLLKVTKGKNLPEVLLYYRLHPQQTIVIKQNKLLEISNKIRLNVVQEYFNLNAAQINLQTHYYFFNEIKGNTSKSILDKYQWKKVLLSSVKHNQYQQIIIKLVQQYWFNNVQTLTQFSIGFLKILCNKYLLSKMKILAVVKFFIKCTIGYKVKNSI